MLKHTTIIINSAALAMVSAFAWSQDVSEAEQTGEATINTGGSRLYFFDRPIQIESEFDDRIDFPFVEPTLGSEDDPEFRQRLESIRNYDASVADIESKGGAWSMALSEELSSLGELHQLQGDHLQAVEIFDRAVHVSRINNGLHTLEQIPAVEQMIESYLALNNWEQADLYYNYLFYIQQKSYGMSDPRLIPVLDRLASWNLRAFNIGFGESLGLRLSTAQILFDAAANMVGVHFGKSDERFIRYQRKIANSAYLTSQHPEIMRELNEPEFRTMQDALLNQFSASGSAVGKSRSAGEKALSEIVVARKEQSASAESTAEAITHLADWYLMFEQRRAAAELYEEAWNLLSESEDSEELLARFFGQVSPLPSFLAEPTSLVFNSTSVRDTSELKIDYADLSFDVTENGIVRNLEVVEGATEYNSAILSRLRREVRKSYFRPVIKDGKPVRTDNNEFRYRYWH